MIVRVKKGQLDYFRRKAINNENEIFAVLAGKSYNQNLVEVHSFLYPELEVSNPSTVQADNSSLEVLIEQVNKRGLTVVGDIHSHPNWAPIMSQEDHKGHKACGNRVSGIVEVTNRKTRVAFWRYDSSLSCTIEYF